MEWITTFNLLIEKHFLPQTQERDYGFRDCTELSPNDGRMICKQFPLPSTAYASFQSDPNLKRSLIDNLNDPEGHLRNSGISNQAPKSYTLENSGAQSHIGGMAPVDYFFSQPNKTTNSSSLLAELFGDQAEEVNKAKEEPRSRSRSKEKGKNTME